MSENNNKQNKQPSQNGQVSQNRLWWILIGIIITFVILISLWLMGWLFFSSWMPGPHHRNYPGRFSQIEVEQKEENQSEALSVVRAAIAQKQADGDYRCCIEPACTMCYLGSWESDDGSCLCDDHAAAGEWDQVCPECKAGMQEGRCQSEQTSTGFCPTDVPS